MQYLFMILFIAGATVLDQLSKLWVVENIPLYSNIEAIPGRFHLTYVQHTGAAFCRVRLSVTVTVLPSMAEVLV